MDAAVPCEHWSDCGTSGGGCCALGLFGGRPSRGTCNACEHNPDKGKMRATVPVQIRLTAEQMAEAQARAKAAQDDRDVRTRALWKELHERALGGGLDQAWLDDFTRRVPCGDCRDHFRAMMGGAFPPVFGPGAFEWTWRVHNAVNRRLGKPEMSVNDARTLYRDASAG